MRTSRPPDRRAGLAKGNRLDYCAAVRASLVLAFLLAAVPAAACADPCKAVPDRGPAPAFLRAGASFSGPVVYVGDGDSLCVAVGPGAQNWVEVRLADFYAPELASSDGRRAKAALERIAMGRTAHCIAEHQSYDRIVARCTVSGQPLGNRMRAAGVAEGGNGH